MSPETNSSVTYHSASGALDSSNSATTTDNSTTTNGSPVKSSSFNHDTHSTTSSSSSSSSSSTASINNVTSSPNVHLHHRHNHNHNNNHNNSNTTTTTTTNSHDKSLSIHIDDHDHHRRLLIDGDTDFSCGIARWHPKWLQRFANKQCFLALFCLTSVLQGVYYTYFVSVLTTIEKLYQIPSKTTGMIMSSTEIGQISGALLLTYYGGQGHRPRWIANGMLVFAAAALLCSTPHYLFGSQPNSIQTTTAAPSSASTATQLCLNTALLLTNGSQEVPLESCLESEVIVRKNLVTNSVLGIFFMSLLLIGLGTTAVNTLGIPYIDDNVAPKESPLYFGITIGVRIFGPVCGFLLGSICTNIPVSFPFGGSDLTPTDTNWIGAWWLGLFLVGVSLTLTAIPMMIFPRRLPTPDPSSYCHQQQQKSLLEHKERLLKEAAEAEAQAKEQEILALEAPPLVTPSFGTNKNNNQDLSQNLDTSLDLKVAKKKNRKKKPKEESPTLSGFSTALKRLLANDILLCRTASSVLHILPISGLYTFLPKYLESQFQLTAGDANIIAGLAGILVMGFGIFSSGTFMRKYKPSAVFVARWLAFAALAYVVGMVMLMFLGCPTNQFAGFSQVDAHGNEYFSGANGSIEKLNCSSNCGCAKGKFDPVCLPDGITYLSPCIAGCTTFYNSSTEKHYVDCACAGSVDSLGLTSQQQVKPGLCSLQCTTLTLYIVIFSVTVLIHSTSEVGSMLLTLRCVEPQDKAMALGFISFAIGLFGNVPCPIIYGAVVDSTCLFWEEDSCGKRGACRLYDSTRFRQWFHGITAFIMFLAFCIDLVVCYKASGIVFHEEENVEDETQETQEENHNNSQEERKVPEGAENDGEDDDDDPTKKPFLQDNRESSC